MPHKPDSCSIFASKKFEKFIANLLARRKEKQYAFMKIMRPIFEWQNKVVTAKVKRENHS